MTRDEQHIGLREQINHPNISGPFDTGWGYFDDFAVEALPDRQRLVFTLSHLDEQTPAEISAATGMSQATVRVHLFRALRKLRGVLGGLG